MPIHEQNDMAKEKAIISNLCHEVLLALHKNFPWTVIEIAISFNERIGAETDFVKKVLDGVLDKESQAKLDEYLPECTETGALPSDLAMQLMNSYSSDDIAKILAQPVFALAQEQKDECLPWDLAEQPVNYDTLGDEKTMAIRNIKMKCRELAMLRGMIARGGDDCGTECIAIDTIFEVLNFSII